MAPLKAWRSVLVPCSWYNEKPGGEAGLIANMNIEMQCTKLTRYRPLSITRLGDLGVVPFEVRCRQRTGRVAASAIQCRPALPRLTVPLPAGGWYFAGF